MDGAPCTTRTCDLLVRSQTLYPTELRARKHKIIPSTRPLRQFCDLLRPRASALSHQPNPASNIPGSAIGSRPVIGASPARARTADIRPDRRSRRSASSQAGSAGPSARTDCRRTPSSSAWACSASRAMSSAASRAAVPDPCGRFREARTNTDTTMASYREADGAHEIHLRVVDRSDSSIAVTSGQRLRSSGMNVRLGAAILQPDGSRAPTDTARRLARHAQRHLIAVVLDQRDRLLAERRAMAAFFRPPTCCGTSSSGTVFILFSPRRAFGRARGAPMRRSAPSESRPSPPPP